MAARRQTMAEYFSLEPAESRLSIPTPARIPLAGMVGFGIGTALGIAQGGQTASLRFRAEHAHKMPTTTTGWYLYHKSKNYHTIHGGFREGLRMGARLSFWTIMAFGLESTVDRYRGSTDLISTVLASLTVAGGFSLVSMSRQSCFPTHDDMFADAVILKIASLFPLQLARHVTAYFLECCTAACRISSASPAAGLSDTSSSSASALGPRRQLK